MNQDKVSAQLATLRKRITELENELVEFRAGRLVVSDSGSVVVNDMATENSMLKTENDKLVQTVSTVGFIALCYDAHCILIIFDICLSTRDCPFLLSSLVIFCEQFLSMKLFISKICFEFQSY